MKIDWRTLYYGTNDPAVRAWLDQRWPEVDEAIRQAVGLHEHEQEVERIASTPTQTVFTVPKSKEDAVREMAAKLGVNITVVPMPVEDVERDLTVNAQASAAAVSGRQRELTPAERAIIREDAKEVAALYVRVTVTAPPVEDRVIATVKDDSGSLDFFNVPFEKPYWNEQNTKHVDFERCDICNKNRRRSKLFVITGRKHGTRIVGGECAARLDLGHKLKEALNGFESFMASIQNSEWQEDEGYGGRGKGACNPVYAVAVAQAVLERMGFVSKKLAKERNTSSTADHVKDAIHTKPEKLDKALRERIRELFGSQAQRLREELLEYIEDKKEQKRSSYDKSGYDMTVRLQNTVHDGNLRGIPLLTFALSDLKNYQAKKAAPKGKTPFWFPSIPFVVMPTASVEFEGPEGTDYSPDRRWRIVGRASAQPVAPHLSDVAHKGRVQIETSVKAGGLANEIVRAIGAYEAPEGSTSSSGSTPNRGPS